MKRRWFQIHLSTAIVMMFVASAFTWANIDEKAGTYDIRIDGFYSGDNIGPNKSWSIGWPYIYRRSVGYDGLEIDWVAYKFRNVGTIQFQFLMCNALIAVFSIGAMTIVIESLIRHREARKP